MNSKELEMSRISHINLKAPGNWINDPNGFIYYKGKYHLFYQYFPYAPVWGTMHWGHAISDDMVDWEHVGIALFPTKEYDRNGVFSGSALEINGQLNLYYTAALYRDEKKENIHLAEGKIYQSQAMITSKTGMDFDNFNDKKLVIPVIEDREIADPFECRDPKVWKEGDVYYMCLASTHNCEKGVLVLFKSEDAVNWTYANRLESDSFGTILECPDMFEIQGKWLLICSPCGNNINGEGYDNQPIIQPVDFDTESSEVNIKGEHRYLDYGLDIYAPQSNLDKDGNRVVISWVRMACPIKPVDNPVAEGKLWNGMMTIPRVIHIENGEIYTSPHENIRKYFQSDMCKCENSSNGIRRYDDSKSQLVTCINEGEWIDINGYRIGLIEGRIVGDRSGLVKAGIDIHKISKTPYVGERAELEIYYDSDLIEIFVNDGKYVLTHVTYINVQN